MTPYLSTLRSLAEAATKKAHQHTPDQDYNPMRCNECLRYHRAAILALIAEVEELRTKAPSLKSD